MSAFSHQMAYNGLRLSYAGLSAVFTVPFPIWRLCEDVVIECVDSFYSFDPIYLIVIPRFVRLFEEIIHELYTNLISLDFAWYNL